ncbi:MAG: hypothetical protein ACRCXB_27925 [Aeromonadaceae bacterium]
MSKHDEFDQIVAETAVRGLVPQYCESIPEPTLDQLLQDWRNADDYAQRKQTEADEAAAMRDERWQAVQARAGEMGVVVERRVSVVVDESTTISECGWISFDGCECPVGERVAGEVKLFCGEVLSTVNLRQWNWSLGRDNPRRIVSYRIAHQ